MADVNYQYPMQLMELLGLRGWDAAQPRVYWGLKRPDGLPESWAAPNAGIGGGAGWGGYGSGYGVSTGGGGGYNSAGVFSSGGGGFAPSAARGSSFGWSPESGDAQSDLGAQAQTPGSGLGATTGSLMDFLGAATTGPFTGGLGLMGQMAYNGITGKPTAPINSLSPISLSSIYNSVFGSDANGAGQGFGGDMGNAATAAAQGDYAGAALDAAASAGGFQGGGAGAGSNSDPGPSSGDPTGGEGPAGLAKGGPVNMRDLVGPNPPGPDDGMAYLDAGEHVLTAEEVRKLGGHGGVMQLRQLLARR